MKFVRYVLYILNLCLKKFKNVEPIHKNLNYEGLLNMNDAKQKLDAMEQQIAFLLDALGHSKSVNTSAEALSCTFKNLMHQVQDVKRDLTRG